MDRYTKGLLTIIAVSFAVLAWRAIDPPAITIQVHGCPPLTSIGFGPPCERFDPVSVRINE